MTTLKDSLRLPERGIFALIGGGGKTSSMYRLAQEYAREGKTVLCTTTTHIMAPQPPFPTALLLEEDTPLARAQLLEGWAALGTPILTFARRTGQDKLCAPDQAFWSWCSTAADIVRIEADGARHLPFKAPAEHEPVVPPCTTRVIGVAGADALLQPIAQFCHRPQLVSALLDLPPESPLTPAGMAQVILSPAGYQKAVRGARPFALILNKCDTGRRLSLAQQTLAQLRARGAAFPIVLCALQSEEFCLRESFAAWENGPASSISWGHS